MKIIMGWIRQVRRNPWHVNAFMFIIAVMAAWAVLIICSIIRLINEHTDWQKIEDKFSQSDIVLPAQRGSILSCDGKPLSATVPEYRLYLDYRVLHSNKKQQDTLQYQRDSIFMADIDSISMGLAEIFPDHDAIWFRRRLEKGRTNYEKRMSGEQDPGSCTWMIYDRLASHIQYKECLKLPLLRERFAISGFHTEKVLKRLRPYDMLCARTIGLMYPETDSAKCGLELSYDSLLRGTPGRAHRVRMYDSFVTITDEEPINGYDLRTSIDITLQDYVDKTLRKQLQQPTVDGDIGIAIVMEVKTGDVKAIVNLQRAEDGRYYEMKNHAVSDLMEPGSTFKPASIMVAMDDGYITENTVVDCMSGKMEMHGSEMRDHNWIRGGYQQLTVSQILEQSSNIGVSKIIDKYYQHEPQRFVDGLLREGVGIPLGLPFVGKGEPVVPSPSSKNRYWSKTDLPWMSIGYVTMLPPISTLTFYNAIANGGKMVQPRFVTAKMKNGIVVEEYPVHVIKDKICKESTLGQIQRCLEHVVSRGLGKAAGNHGQLFPVSGKTGTAQYAVNGGYKARKYLVSFCGYFPSDAPRYSCIVCIVKTGLPAAGGTQCGPVFSEIAKFAMGRGDYRDPSEAGDTISVFVPSIKRSIKEDKSPMDVVPNVIGMGARDAVFLLQKRGLRVKIHGGGTVTQQSVAPRTPANHIRTITITLENNQK